MKTNQKNSLHTFVVLAYKESKYLDSCLNSVTNQSYPSNVIIATTTPNSHIARLAKKYNVKTITGKHTNIGGDFDFAKNSGTTELVTVAHQDDIYDESFSENVVAAFRKNQESSIIFTNYYEIRNGNNVYSNALLRIKHVLLLPLSINKSAKSIWRKRLILRFGNSICCPAVTFVRKNCPKEVFSSDFQCNVDWHAWEKLSRSKGAFTYIKKPLMGHRISEESTTSEIIKNGIRTKEDYELFKRFWPKPLAKILTKFYQKSEKSNSLKD